MPPQAVSGVVFKGCLGGLGDRSCFLQDKAVSGIFKLGPRQFQGLGHTKPQENDFRPNPASRF